MTCSFWTFPAHSSLIAKHPHAPISCKLFRVSLSISTFHVLKSQGPASRTGYVTAAQIPVPKCSCSSWASQGGGKLLPQSWEQESSTCGCHLSSFSGHSKAKAAPRACRNILCVPGGRGRGRKRKGWVSGHARGFPTCCLHQRDMLSN